MLRHWLFLCGALSILAPAARAEMIDHERQYKSCMALVKRNPKQAFEAALAWRDMGGGNPARHCAALALVGLGEPGEGATRLEGLAQDIKADGRFKARILAQAGQAWLLAQRPDRALAAQDASLKLKPEDAEVLTDRAQSHVAMGNPAMAIADLDAALKSEPEKIETLVFRASAKRQTGDAKGALEDVERALKLDPNFLEALLERGLLRRAANDSDGARKDWMRILELSPDSPATRAAQGHIEAMDLKPEGVGKAAPASAKKAK